MSKAAPTIIRHYDPDKNRQVEALRLLLKRGKKTLPSPRKAERRPPMR